MDSRKLLEDLNHIWPDKFLSEEEIFGHIHVGDGRHKKCGQSRYS